MEKEENQTRRNWGGPSVLTAFAWLEQALQLLGAFQMPPSEMASELEAQLELEGEPFPPCQPTQGMDDKPEPASSADFPHQIRPPG